MKYIIFEEAGLEFPVLFPDFIEHHRVAMKFLSAAPKSAGWVKLEKDVSPFCSGQSVSLELESRPDNDSIIITEHFTKSIWE